MLLFDLFCIAVVCLVDLYLVYWLCGCFVFGCFVFWIILRLFGVVFVDCILMFSLRRFVWRTVVWFVWGCFGLFGLVCVLRVVCFGVVDCWILLVWLLFGCVCILVFVWVGLLCLGLLVVDWWFVLMLICFR